MSFAANRTFFGVAQTHMPCGIFVRGEIACFCSRMSGLQVCARPVLFVRQ
jgi:hypothetical protein